VDYDSEFWLFNMVQYEFDRDSTKYELDLVCVTPDELLYLGYISGGQRYRRASPRHVLYRAIMCAYMDSVPF
jgi:hypothetical protein